MIRNFAVLLVVSLGVSSAMAGIPVQVTIHGAVEFNLINPDDSPLGNVAAGDAASMTFQLDSDLFVDNMLFPTRAYEIDQSSFDLTMGPESVGLQAPFPAGLTPSFVIRNDDPAVDGFFVSDSPNFPNGVPTDEPGAFGQFKASASVTYDGTTLDSLDILDALGSYDFTGIQVFNYTVTDGPVDVIGVIFSDMTIEAIPEPNTALATLAAGLVCLQWKRKRSLQSGHCLHKSRPKSR